MSTGSSTARRPSPSIATLLSFLWPGLGQWYAGFGRSAVIFALPVVVVAIVLAFQLVDGMAELAVTMLAPSTALTVLILIGLLGIWRLIAMGDALLAAGRGRTWRRPAPLATFAILAAVVIGAHVGAASLAWSFYRAGSEIFVADNGPDSTPQPAASEPIGGFVATPAATPETKESRINFLLTGIDSSERRTHALTDTLLVVSVDPTTGKVAMVSFPRDIARFELSNGKVFRGKINSLMTYASNHPDEFPDGGLPTLVKELGYLLGIPIHYYAAVDLEGFAKMIDRVGGVTINNTTAINDPSYGGWTNGHPIGFRLSKGRHTLDGQEALAFVRSRMGVNGSDFRRAHRQQQLLVALQRKLMDPAMIPNLPGILSDAEGTIVTNFPVDRVSDMLEIGQRVDEDQIERVVLNTPYSNRPPASDSNGLYYLKLDMDKLAELSVEMFGDDSRYAASSGAAAPVAP